MVNKPPNVEGGWPTLRWMLGQMWRDLLSVYYANSMIWRWLKSGALLFLGFCVWAGASVVLSVQPSWTFLYFVMAYGFLLILWGPLTHFLLVPGVLRLRRTASHPVSRLVARHGGKINLSIFFLLVVLLAMYPPGAMMLEFAPPALEDNEPRSGAWLCDEPADGEITCQVHEPSGIDHVIVRSDGEEIARADDPPFKVTLSTDALADDGRYVVEYRDAGGDLLRRFTRTA